MLKETISSTLRRITTALMYRGMTMEAWCSGGYCTFVNNQVIINSGIIGKSIRNVQKIQGIVASGNDLYQHHHFFFSSAPVSLWPPRLFSWLHGLIIYSVFFSASHFLIAAIS
jgi:hypothetical protein